MWIPNMFVSFFPRPRLFFLSAIVWTALAMAFWYGFADDLIGSSAPQGVGVALFWSARSLWFDLYFALSVAVFAAAWILFAPHPWAPWSILGSARLATTREGLGVNLISAVLTLLALLPVLVRLSSNVTELPLIGSIPYPLVFAAVIWSVLGTGALALIGIRLPGIEFFNQRVEAAYRKELVLGEDDPARVDPPTVSELFGAIRRNYFRLYLNFMYFNIGRIVYLQTDVIFPYILLGPTIIAGKITLGSMNQILNAFTQVRTSFQYLVNSWSTIVELLSIYQRLRGFEARISGEPLPSIETRTEPASL